MFGDTLNFQIVCQTSNAHDVYEKENLCSIQELRTGRDDSKFWCLYSTSVARPQPLIYRPPMRSDHFIVGPHILVETQRLYWAVCPMT